MTMKDNKTRIVKTPLKIGKSCKKTNQLKRCHTEDTYRSIIDNISDGIYRLNTDGYFTFVNKSITDRSGIPAEQFYTLRFLDIIAPEYHEEAKRNFQRIMKGEDEIVSELKYKNNNGQVRIVEVRSRPICEDGKIVGLLGISRDITECKRPEEALEFNKTFLNTSAIGILTYKESGQCTYANEAAAGTGGTNVAGLLEQNFHQIQSWRKSGMYEAALKALSTGAEQEIETPLRTTFGKDVWLNLRFSPFYYKGENHLLVFTHDITDRKHAEEGLRESEGKYRSIFENAIEGIFQTTFDGHCLSVNPAFADMFGYDSPEEMLRSVTDIGKQLDVDAENRKDRMRQLEEKGVIKNYETRAYRKDGSIIWVSINTRLLKNSIGEPMHYEGFIIDITEHKRAEDTLRESEHRFATAFSSSPICASLSRLSDGRFLDVNDAFLRLFGYERKQVIGSNPLMLNMWVNLEDRARMVQMLREGGRAESFETQFRTQSGDVRDVTVVPELVYVEEERYMLGLTLDVTERKRTEEELKCYAKELEDANTALRVFMSRRDHDQKMLEEKLQFNIEELVAPYLKRLKETNLDSRQKNYLDVLESNLTNIVSPYIFNLSATYKNLTPQEIQIANLIRQGKNTKEIAELLCASVHTIGTHRNNIRRKLNLRNSKANFRSHLLSLSDNV
jgi:PAS domain S-box-containing protein